MALMRLYFQKADVICCGGRRTEDNNQQSVLTARAAKMDLADRIKDVFVFGQTAEIKRSF
jgi:hypothetical protein